MVAVGAVVTGSLGHIGGVDALDFGSAVDDQTDAIARLIGHHHDAIAEFVGLGGKAKAALEVHDREHIAPQVNDPHNIQGGFGNQGNFRQKEDFLHSIGIKAIASLVQFDNQIGLVFHG